MVTRRDPPIFLAREAGDVPSPGVRRRNKETKMYTYTEAELLRVARVRTDPVSTQRMIDLSEANRLAAQARAQATLAAHSSFAITCFTTGSFAIGSPLCVVRVRLRA